MTAVIGLNGVVTSDLEGDPDSGRTEGHFDSTLDDAAFIGVRLFCDCTD